jgi:hypothetical protein
MPPPDLRHIPDNELWLMIIDGNVAAYAELYERYWESLFETAYWHLFDKAAEIVKIKTLFQDEHYTGERCSGGYTMVNSKRSRGYSEISKYEKDK